MLADFEEAYPGTAAQILAMARDEQLHRHRMQSRTLWCNLAIALLCILGAVLGAYIGELWAIVILGGSGVFSGLISLVARFWLTAQT